MYYLILLVGLLLLMLNVYTRHQLLKNTVHSSESPRSQLLPVAVIQSTCAEWRNYALGDNTWAGRRGFLIAVTIFAGMSFVNLNWLQFDWVIFIPLMMTVLFIGQLRLGRMLHHKNFENSFPEVLSTINASISSGNSIHQALHRCGEGISGDLGTTFNRIDRRLNLGEEAERVFGDARKNYPYREFYFFSIVMLVSLDRGGQLRLLISRLSRIVSTSKTMARRKKAMTSEARASAKIVAAIPILFFLGMKYLSPENYDFVVHDSVGRIILYYVIGSELIGMTIIWLLLRRAT